MTLLIATISKKHVVITADAISRANRLPGEGVGSETLYKIFPVPGTSVAFSNHGFNILMGKSVGEFTGDYIRQYGTDIGTTSVKETAEDSNLIQLSQRRIF
jgi:hypothetical protein